MSEKDWVEVAKLGRTVGLKGYLKLHNLSDFIDQFKRGVSFFTKNPQRELKLKYFNPMNSCVLFENYEDIQSAKELVNLILYQSIELTRKNCILKKDEFFYFDILQCELFYEKQRLGRVVNILEVGQTYLFEIQSDSALIAKNYTKIFYIPYLDSFIRKIDIKKYRIFCTQQALLILEHS